MSMFDEGNSSQRHLASPPPGGPPAVPPAQAASESPPAALAAPDTPPGQPATVPKWTSPGSKSIYMFNPKPDITAIEMASSMVIALFGVGVMANGIPAEIVDQAYLALTDGAKRHWHVMAAPKRSQIAVPGRRPSGGLHLPPGAR